MTELLCESTSFCAGCGVSIAIRLISKGCPENVIVSQATSCAEVCTSIYPKTSWNVPWVHAAFETAASVASGIEAAVKKLGKDWKVLAIAGDGGTADIGFQALSGMLERGHKVTFVCVDNESYSNCLSLSTTVMTKNGLKKITEIKKGDEIYAFDQKNYQLVIKKCDGVFDNGKKRVFEIETLHHNIKATSNHPFLVLEHNGRGKSNGFVWKTLSKLRKGDEIVVLKNLDEGNSYTFKPTKISRKGDYKVNKINHSIIPKKSSKELMEFLGIYVGDGWVRSGKGRTETGFSVPEDNKTRKRLLKLIDNVFEAKSTTSKNEVHIQSINVSMFIRSLGLGKGSKNKTIPSWIFTLPIEEREAFIKGLLASDGYISNKTSMRYVSVSYDLLKRLRLLLQTMDYRVGKIHWRKTPKGTHCVYRKLLKDSWSGYVCFSKKHNWNIKDYSSQYRYQNFLIENKHFNTEIIKSKKPCGIEPTLDLRIEGEHNFIADGIVVHNTGVQRSGATPYGAWTTTSPPGKENPIGNKTFKKPIAEIAAAHGIPYVATASIAYPADLIEKTKKAFENQPSFLHIHCPCPVGWKSDTAKVVGTAKLAVETGMWALFEINNGQMVITKRVGKKKPIEEYLAGQGRFKHILGNKEEIKKIQKHIDSEWERFERIEKSGTRF